MRFDLLALISRDTTLKRTSARQGGEYSGPCPLCRRGTDRFKVWPTPGRWACLGASAGRAGCDLGGDAIQYLRQRDGLSFAEACARLQITQTTRGRPSYAPTLLSNSYAAPFHPPPSQWQARGRAWVERCRERLFSGEGERALRWLHKRRLCDDTLRGAGFGYQPRDEYEAPALWGLGADTQAEDARPRRIWLPRGIVIPWLLGDALWRINVRRPLTARQAEQGQARYIGPSGFANGLFNAGALAPGRPVVLVEGEIDALTVQQACGERVAAVATGSTAGSRRALWVARLALAPRVLVAFDADANGAGDAAAQWWLRTLSNARRWRPLAHDVNAMASEGLDVADWVRVGLES